MSALGQGQTFNSVRVTSALPPITDSKQTLRHVGYGPKPDSCTAANAVAIYTLVAAPIPSPISPEAPNLIAKAELNLISSPATIRFKEGQPSAVSTPSRTQTCVVFRNFGSDEIRKTFVYRLKRRTWNCSLLG